MEEKYGGSYGGSYGGARPGRQTGNMAYTVDMVFCIDATGSMEDLTGNQQRIINMVKENALSFYQDMERKMQEKKKVMAQLRVRVIAFRDYLADGAQAMMATDFYLLPQQAAEFEACIKSIHADGGGDIPEDGLEALAYAMRSNWTEHGDRKRQVIVIWTDAGTHELGFGARSPYYPKGMPKDLSELEDWWDAMNNYAKRLIIYAPKEKYWNYISENWEKVVQVDSAAGDGMAEHEFEDILNVIANSI